MPLLDDSARPQVAFFLPHLGGGGTERMVAALANGMSIRGYRVDMILVRAVGVYLQTLHENIHVVDLRANNSYASLPRLIAYLRQRRPRVLVSALNVTNSIALIARWLSASRCLVAIRIENTISMQRRIPWRKAVEKVLLKLIYPHADRIIAVSRAVAADASKYVGLSPSRIDVVYNPVITPSLFHGESQVPMHPWFAEGCPPVILGAGRLTPQKDFVTLLKAFAVIRRERPARLIILGDGIERNMLLAMAREMRIENDVDMPGFVADSFAFMKSCAVFVLSSIYEGLPTVLIEALASGCPVISTDCPGGSTEILAEGAFGELVPVGDPTAMAVAIGRILEGDRKYVDAAWLDQFGIESVLDQNLDILGLRQESN
ncbi:MAG: glycosyltransferase [Anaerolineales bacterium]